MGQRIFYNYKDDDDTWSLIRWRLGVHRPGLYRGFEAAAFASGLTLTLNHATTGAISMDQSSVAEANYGVSMSKQGSIIRDDSVINLTIATNSGSANGRVDLIYMEHEYQSVIGGLPTT